VTAVIRGTASNPQLTQRRYPLLVQIGGLLHILDVLGRREYERRQGHRALAAAASGKAIDSSGVTVTQQGDELAAEKQRIDDLLTPLGNINAAVQVETKARSDGDSALGTRVTPATPLQDLLCHPMKRQTPAPAGF